jgi:hypothetical protein
MNPRRISFAFRSSYRGDVDYTAWINGAEHRLRLRESPSGPVASFAGEPVPADVLAAFNAWRTARHAEQIATMQAKPHLYELTPDMLTPPAPASAGK